MTVSDYGNNFLAPSIMYTHHALWCLKCWTSSTVDGI